MQSLLVWLGSPLWVILLIAAVAVAVSLYVSLWSVIVSFWAVFGSLIGGAVGGVAGGVYFIVVGYLLSGLASIAAGLVCAGLSIFAFFGCREATKGSVQLTKLVILGIKRLFERKGEA